MPAFSCNVLPGRRMSEKVVKGSWVEIQSIILAAGERAPQVPDDTNRVPLEMRVKGFLASSAVLGEQVEILTVAGRRLFGTLHAVNPPYTHGFGAPIPELLGIGGTLRDMLRKKAKSQ